MKCKYCDTVVEDGMLQCPRCGATMEPEEDVVSMPDLDINEVVLETKGVEDQQPKLTAVPGNVVGQAMGAAPQKKKRKWGWIISGIALILVAALLITVSCIYCFKENNIQFKKNYTVPDIVLKLFDDTVIATAGDRELTNGMLQIYYWTTVSDYLYNNQGYLNILGLDYTKPLHNQTSYADKNMSWQQVFLSNALEEWYRFAVLGKLAEDNGYELPEELEKELEALPDELAKDLDMYGYKSLEEMLQKELGAGCTVERYVEYMREYYIGMSYFTELYESIKPSMDELEAYFEENEALFEESNITKESGKFVDVRHILLEPVDADSDETISDAEWEACRQSAQAILDEWLAGEKTEDSFANLAVKHSADDGSKENGGLYAQVTSGEMVEEFDAWIFDEARVIGDYGLVKTEFGYHIMYFSGAEDIWVYYSRECIREERSTEVLEEGIIANPMEINFKAILLCKAEAYED